MSIWLVYVNCGDLDCKESQPVHSKGDQPWVLFGRNDAKAETPALWPPHVKSWLIGKDSDAGRNWGQEEKGMTEDEMAGWHHQLDGREFEWTPGVGDGQGGLACCNSWGRKESDTTEPLNWTELNWIVENKSPFQVYSFFSYQYVLCIILRLYSGYFPIRPGVLEFKISSHCLCGKSFYILSACCKWTY